MRRVSTFMAGTWNMGGGEGPDGPTFQEVKDVVRQMERSGVTVYLFQEAQKDENIAFLNSMNLQTHQYGRESVIAWSDAWVAARTYGINLHPNNPYHRVGNPKDIYSIMAQAVLCNKAGQTIDVGSYHTPSHVQVEDKPKNRIAALREAMLTMKDIADNSLCSGVLLGGDDNVDETRGAHGPWNFMLERATGLRQVVAPRNTLGFRKVDDFRVKRLVPVGKGKVIHGPTHHNAFVQDFSFLR